MSRHKYLLDTQWLLASQTPWTVLLLSIMGTVGIKLELPFSAQVSSCPRLDRFQTPCLPNNLSGEESDQPRQKTRLTVPDCAVEEIRGLTEWSYSISSLTDGGRQLHRETKTEGLKKCLRVFLSGRCLFDCEVKGGSGDLFGRLTLKPQWTDLSLTSCAGRRWTQTMTLYHLPNLKQSMTVVEVA